jgi:hypothetical protein
VKSFRLPVAFAVAVACALTLGMTRATVPGTELRSAAAAVQRELSSTGAVAPYTLIRIDIVRDTPASIAINDLAMSLADMQANGSGANQYLSNHHRRAVQAIAMGPGHECRIVASAQAFDDRTTSIGALLTYTPNTNAAWTYALLHEAAHCSWNPALRMTQYLTTHRRDIDNPAARALLFDLAQEIGEGYADSYAVFMLRRGDLKASTAMPTMISSWRRDTSTARAVHHTTASLACASTVALEAVRAGTQYEGIHEKALMCSLLSAREWLTANRIEHEDGERYIALVASMADIPKQ